MPTLCLSSGHCHLIPEWAALVLHYYFIQEGASCPLERRQPSGGVVAALANHL